MSWVGKGESGMGKEVGWGEGLGCYTTVQGESRERGWRRGGHKGCGTRSRGRKFMVG